jgi:hypothetical protein
MLPQSAPGAKVCFTGRVRKDLVENQLTEIVVKPSLAFPVGKRATILAAKIVIPERGDGHIAGD